MKNRVGLYRKLFAKGLDFAILYVMMCLAVLAWPFLIDESIYLYLLVASPFLWIPLEILLLSTWGRTPGGVILGIAPRNLAGKPLTRLQILRLGFFLERKDSIKWIYCKGSTGRTLTSLGIGVSLLVSAIIVKAVFEFPGEFERTFGKKDWVHYTSSEGEFAADFPVKPTVNEKQLPIPQAKRTLDYNEYSSEHSKVTYSVSVLELPRKWRFFSSNIILKGALSVVLDNTNNAKLISKTSVKHGEYPALDFHVRENDFETRGRLILVAAKLYKVEFSQHFDRDAETEGSTFIQSFTPTQ